MIELPEQPVDTVLRALEDAGLHVRQAQRELEGADPSADVYFCQRDRIALLVAFTKSPEHPGVLQLMIMPGDAVTMHSKGPVFKGLGFAKLLMRMKKYDSLEGEVRTVLLGLGGKVL